MRRSGRKRKVPTKLMEQIMTSRNESTVSLSVTKQVKALGLRKTFLVPAGNPAGIMVRYRVMMQTATSRTFGTIKTRLFIALILVVA